VPPLLLDGCVVTVSTDGRIQAWDPEDGARRWNRRIKLPIEARPASGRGPHGDVVVVAPGGRGPGLTALDLGSGRVVWSLRLESPAIQVEAKDTLLLVLDQAGAITARGLRDGRQVWSRPAGGWRSPGFLLDAERLYAAARDDSVTALDPRDGRTLWRTRVRGRFSAPPVLCGARLALATDEGEICWVRSADGAFETRTLRAGPHVAPGVAVGERLLTVSGGGAVELAGPVAREDDWRRDLEAAVVASPAVRDDRVYVATTRGALRVLQLTDGAPLGVSQSRAGFRVAPGFAGPRLVLADDKGNLHAYRF
jgi:outer membrane protein assembly factor BamB